MQQSARHIPISSSGLVPGFNCHGLELGSFRIYRLTFHYYIFDPSYTDFCHPNYPECVDGQNGCPNCDAPDNPILNVAAKVLTYSNNVNVFDGATSHLNENSYGITIHPNPSSGIFKISSCKQEPMNVTIVSITGRTIKDFKWYGDEKTINLSDLQKGTYIFKASGKNGVEIKKLVIM